MTAAAAEARGFPWQQVMAIGLSLLRLPPRDFWAMTPRELAAAAGWLGAPGTDAPRRAEIETMMRIFPDENGRKTKDG